MSVLLPIAQQATLKNHATVVVVRVTWTERVFSASVGRGRTEFWTPRASGNVIETRLFLAPTEATVVTTASDDEDLVVAQERCVCGEQVTRRLVAHGPGAERRIFLRSRSKTEAAQDD